MSESSVEEKRSTTRGTAQAEGKRSTTRGTAQAEGKRSTTRGTARGRGAARRGGERFLAWYSRKGGNKTAHDWETKLRPFVEQWRTTSSVHWHEEALFDRAAHEPYLRWYRPQTRLRCIPRADPEDMEMAHTSTSETHYSSSVTSIIDHSAQLTLEAQEETAAIIN